MNMYRIHFETNIPRSESYERIHKAAETLPGYTLYETQGAWEGIISESWVIEYFAEEELATVKAVAERLKFDFQQHAVLVTAVPLATFVTV